MNGLSVTATFSVLGTQTRAWAAGGGPGSGGVSGTGWSLTLGGDSFSTPWNFTFAAGSNVGQLTHLVLSGVDVFTIFDRTLPNPGTDGSAQGLDFAISSGCADCDGTANYFGQTGIAGAAPLSDLWQGIDITFTGDTGPRTNFSFVQDTDNDIRAMIPEPETYALMLGGLGLMTMIARRRRARSS